MVHKGYNFQVKDHLSFLIVFIATTYIQQLDATFFCDITCDALACTD